MRRKRDGLDPEERGGLLGDWDLDFALWIEGTAARGRCHMLNQGVHNLRHPPGSIEGMVEASRLEPFLPDNIECLLFA